MRRVSLNIVFVALVLCMSLFLFACDTEDPAPEPTPTPTSEATQEQTTSPDVYNQYEDEAEVTDENPELTPEPVVDIINIDDFDTQADVILYILMYAISDVEMPDPDIFNPEWLEWAVPELVNDFMSPEFVTWYVDYLEHIMIIGDNDEFDDLRDEYLEKQEFHIIFHEILSRLQDGADYYFTVDEAIEYAFLMDVSQMLLMLPDVLIGWEEAEFLVGHFERR